MEVPTIRITDGDSYRTINADEFDAVTMTPWEPRVQLSADTQQSPSSMLPDTEPVVEEERPRRTRG